MGFSFKNVIFNGTTVSVPISPYPYRKCQPRVKELRFVRVLAAGEEDDVIECQIFHDVLDNVGYFAALSYEWGDPSCYATIYLDGIQIPVTVKMFEALRHLRKIKCPTLWIDAVCIDQENDLEKNAHLKLMKDIYHEANMVCAYVGPAADESDKVMELLRAIDRSREPDPDRHTASPWTPSALQLLSRKAELEAFFNRSYWHRVWIIQEVALSARLRVFCGSLSVRWIAFEVLLPLLTSIQEFTSMDFTIQYLHQMRLKQLNTTPIGLLQLLYSSRFAKATNPRDRVYALLGLAFDGEDFVDEPHYDWGERAICIDVTRTLIARRRSLDIIFARTESTKNDLPTWCPNYFSVPSEKIWDSIAAYITGFDERFRLGQKSAKWTATSNSIVARRDLSFSDDRSLNVRGFSLGVIDSIGCTVSDPVEMLPKAAGTGSADPHHQQGEEELFITLSRVLNMYSRPAPASKMKPKPTESHADNVSGSRAAPKLYYHLFEFQKFYNSKSQKHSAEFEKIREWRNRNKNFMVSGVSFEKRSHNFNAVKQSGRVSEMSIDMLGILLTSAVSGAVTGMFGSSSGATTPSQFTLDAKMPPNLESELLSLSDLIDEGLRLITTKSGYIGWAHPSAQLGDHVYLLQACSMPAIVRPSQPDGDAGNVGSAEPQVNNSSSNNPRSFTVVGHGLIEKAMDGALWANLMQNSTAEHVRLL